MSRRRLLVLLQVVALLGTFVGVSAVARAADEPGLAVGEMAPDFSLPDQNGKIQQLSELLKKGDVAVVFHRSASW